ncbi:MAG: hypothetical protein IJ945_04100 [Oscillospiraceae bacterium]|nr:hypothetical protein [Oscillospiraceae bacterium]
MAFNLFARKPKPKPVIERIKVEDCGEPKYVFTHVPTLEVYREYNDTVSAPAIARDKQLKRFFGIVMGVICAAFTVGAVLNFDLPEYLAEGRSLWQWFSYTGFMFWFAVAIMSGYLCYHLLTYYHFFPKRLEKATAEYYKSSKYLTNEIVLACYEEGVLEKAEPRDEFFEWGMFNRCWESENVVYLEFTLANQLFVAKEVMLEAGANIEEFMAWANEHIEEGKKIMAEREAAEEAAEEAEDEEMEEIEKEIEALEAELEETEDEDLEEKLEDKIEELEEKAEELEEKLDD